MDDLMERVQRGVGLTGEARGNMEHTNECTASVVEAIGELGRARA